MKHTTTNILRFYCLLAVLHRKNRNFSWFNVFNEHENTILHRLRLKIVCEACSRFCTARSTASQP